MSNDDLGPMSGWAKFYIAAFSGIAFVTVIQFAATGFQDFTEVVVAAAFAGLALGEFRESRLERQLAAAEKRLDEWAESEAS